MRKCICEKGVYVFRNARKLRKHWVTRHHTINIYTTETFFAHFQNSYIDIDSDDDHETSPANYSYWKVKGWRFSFSTADKPLVLYFSLLHVHGVFLPPFTGLSVSQLKLANFHFNYVEKVALPSFLATSPSCWLHCASRSRCRLKVSFLYGGQGNKDSRYVAVLDYTSSLHINF